MKKTSNFFGIIVICVLCVIAGVFYSAHIKKSESTNKNKNYFNYNTPESVKIFSDGLHNPASVTNYELNEFDIGTAQKSIYYIDINNDTTKDRITKTFIETGNAHSYFSYKIELKNGDRYIDITPNNLHTTNGASCDLQQIQFSFTPKFKITVISRELGATWPSPTMAYRQEYILNKENKFIASDKQQIRPVCDVKELF